MPNSSSRERVVFTAKPRAFALALHDDTRRAEPSAPPRRFDIKSLQRRAYERGRQVERENSAAPLAELVAHLAASIAKQKRDRDAERAQVTTFAVELASEIASRLTAKIIDAEEHDVAGMVGELLAELDEAESHETAVLRLAPADRARLDTASFAGVGLDVIADDGVSPGNMTLERGDGTSVSVLMERLDAMRAEMLRRAHDDA